MGRVHRLDIDGRPQELSVVVASRLWSRALGLWPGRPWPAFDILLLPRCRAIHTFGMRVPIDVVFSDPTGRVTSVRPAIRPWRVAVDRAASCAWEMRAGSIERLGLRRGRRLRASERMRGATAVEFLLAAMLVVIPFSFAVIELAQLATARHVLQHAINETARQASVGERSELALRRSLGVGILPLFVPLDARAAFDTNASDGSGDRLSVSTGRDGLARAYAEMFRPDLTSVSLEPLDDAGRVLRLRVRYCRELYLPLIRQFIPEVLQLGTVSPFDQACYEQGRMPLEAWSLVLLRDDSVRRAGDLPELPPGDDGQAPADPLPDPGGGGGGRGGGGREDESEGDSAAH